MNDRNDKVKFRLKHLKHCHKLGLPDWTYTVRKLLNAALIYSSVWIYNTLIIIHQLYPLKQN